MAVLAEAVSEYSEAACLRCFRSHWLQSGSQADHHSYDCRAKRASVEVETAARLAVEAVVGLSGVRAVRDNWHVLLVSCVAGNVRSLVDISDLHRLAILLKSSLNLARHRRGQVSETALVRHVKLGLALAALRILVVQHCLRIAHSDHLLANLCSRHHRSLRCPA